MERDTLWRQVVDTRYGRFGGWGGDGVLIVCRGLMVCACGRLLGSDKTPFNDLLALRWGMALLSGFGMIRGVGSSL